MRLADRGQPTGGHSGATLLKPPATDARLFTWVPSAVAGQQHSARPVEALSPLTVTMRGHIRAGPGVAAAVAAKEAHLCLQDLFADLSGLCRNSDGLTLVGGIGDAMAVSRSPTAGCAPAHRPAPQTKATDHQCLGMEFSPISACFPQFSGVFSTVAGAAGCAAAWVSVVLWEIRFPVDTRRCPAPAADRSRAKSGSGRSAQESQRATRWSQIP